MIWIKNFERIKRKSKLLFSLLLISCVIYIAIRFSKECSTGVLSGLAFCMAVLIPSLFIFLVIASYISSSKAFFAFSKLFGKATQKLFNIPKISSGVIFLSVLGGYPVGARCVKTLYENKSITKEQAKKLAVIAVCCGPSFVLNFVGSALLNNNKAGAILLASQIIAFITIALICGKAIKVNDETIKSTDIGNSSGLVKAVEGGCKATVSMCSMVIVFSAIISVCEKIFAKYPVLCDYLTIFLEVTTACNKLYTTYPLHLLSFAIGFGGLSVHFQIYSILKDIGVNKVLFFFVRIIQGIISAFVTYILLILFPCSIEVFSTVTDVNAGLSTSILGCCALIITAVCFLNSLSNIEIKRR